MDEIRSGDIVDEKENLPGRHKGIIHYTVGQRKGFVSLLKDLKRKHVLTVVLAAHNPALAGIAVRVIELKDGRTCS